MNFRTFALAATIAVVAPALCNASPETTALNACARAFASSLASPGAAIPAFKVIYGDARSGTSVTEFFAREYSFDLRANSRKTGLRIARANCATDARGSVIALSLIPSDVPESLRFAAQD